MAIQGYPSSYRAPFTAVELRFGQGASIATAPGREACYVGPMTSAGAWTANTLYEVKTEKEVIDGAGVGSMLHRMVRMHLKTNPRGRLYCLPYAASSGGGGVATATGTITVGGSPTSSGQFRVYVSGELVAANYTTSSTPTTIGDDLAGKINGKTHLPYTASNSSGTITLTAKIAGASQGTASVGVHRFRAEVDVGTGITAAQSAAALGLSTGVAGADGTTTELANLTTALATIANRRFYYMGFSVWSSADTAAIETHIATKSEASPGHRSTGWFGYPGTLANASTIAVARNSERVHLVWQKNSEHDPAELTANVMAIAQKYEATDSAFPGFDAYNGSDWHILPAYASSDWPSETDLNDAVTDGIIPIASNQYGSNIVMMVNTRSKNSAGTIDDFRSCERHRVSVIDDLADTAVLRHQVRLASGGFKLRADKLNADGSIDVNQNIGPRVMTPSLFKAWFIGVIREFVQAEKLQNLAEWVDATSCDIEENNVARMSTRTAGRTVDLMHQAEFLISETTPA